MRKIVQLFLFIVLFSFSWVSFGGCTPKNEVKSCTFSSECTTGQHCIDSTCQVTATVEKTTDASVADK